MTHDPPARHVVTWPDQGVSMAFRCIPAGAFRMGSRGYLASEEPIHVVNISEFWLAETPVTQAQFAIWTKAEHIKHTNHFDGRPDHPAEDMDWHQSIAYCDWLTRTKRGEFPSADLVVCLPSEAQWEYACRAGTLTEYSTGDGTAALDDASWYDEDLESGSTHPVRQKQPNEFMLYDMHGNVWEWCRDAWDEKAYRKRLDRVCDPEIFADGDDRSLLRVLRGGSWHDSADWCRSAFRLGDLAGFSFRIFGFRVCLARSPAEQTER